jgi:hypothetical protein
MVLYSGITYLDGVFMSCILVAWVITTTPMTAMAETRTIPRTANLVTVTVGRTGGYGTFSAPHVPLGIAKNDRQVSRHVRLMLPAQPVDATPSSALIRQCFGGRTICLALLDQNPARAAFLLV